MSRNNQNKTKPSEALGRFCEAHHQGHLLYNGPINQKELRNFWTKASRTGSVISADWLFYLGVDILRLWNGQEWFTALSPKLGGHKYVPTWFAARQDHDNRIYTLSFSQPAFVSAYDFLSLGASGDLPPFDRLMVVRNPIKRIWSLETKSFYGEKFVYMIGVQLVLQSMSRIKPLNLEQQEINEIARVLWEAHTVNLQQNAVA